jgi:cobalamin biosynthesis Mg chelatase CobN
VWIVFLFFGPLSTSICFEWFVYTTVGTEPVRYACTDASVYAQTWIIVKSEAIITQLVFEHSLRIRVKAEVEKSDDKEQAKTAEPLALDSPVEPGHAEEATDTTTVAEGSESASISRGTTESTIVHSSSSSVSETASGSAKKGKKKDDGDSLKKSTKGKGSKEKKEDKKAETGNLVGKINNLVTTDLNNITTAREFLRVFVLAPIQIGLCVLFLYVLLGWR